MESIKEYAAFLFRLLSPPPQWRVPVIVLMGAVLGLGGFIIVVSRAPSYLFDDPRTCLNCHIMGPQYSGWVHGSHRRHATCNDCHVPHDNIFRSYYFKAKDGSRHAAMFTLRLEPQAIRIHHAGEKVVQDNCKRCHAHLLSQTSLGLKTDFSQENRCWSCHRNMAHGKSGSLSSVPLARIPTTGSILPDWLRDMLAKKEEKGTFVKNSGG